ncbi:MAG: bifunctional glutamate N-acetyltransferase/amino-acid acetyltransferase ArgJ [Candidatus Omnitrophota bacterium]
MKLIRQGVTAAQGFKASGITCGIKRSKKKDLALIFSQKPCVAAGAFTTNKVQASCVVINKEHLKDHCAQAIIANSGNANCMTGKSGFENSRKMAGAVAKAMKIKPSDVLVASTGVIGKPLPIKKIVGASAQLAAELNSRGSEHAAAAILTTDHQNKEMAVEFSIGGRKVRLGAIAKGSGMLHPDMTTHGPKHATMLCFVTTDAVILPAALTAALERAVQKSFNTITVDGDMSTNDMVLVLANGMAANRVIAEDTKEFRIFAKALEAVCLALAKEMIRDAEGATKFIEVCVKNAQTKDDARRVAKAVAGSNLVKCAVFGEDPNWGRIAAAAGYSGAHLDPWKLCIALGSETVLKNGSRLNRDQSVLNRVFAKKNIKITVDLGLGKFGATAYTCDLSTNYVRINSAYRT